MTAGPDVPIGKKSSGSSSRQSARWRQSMSVYSSVSSNVCDKSPASVRDAGRHRLPSAVAQRLPAFVTGRLRSSRDVFTSPTRVKQNEVVAAPLVSNLTTPVIGPPLDRFTTPRMPLTATGVRVLGDHPQRGRDRPQTQPGGGPQVVAVDLPALRAGGREGQLGQVVPPVQASAARIGLGRQ